MLQLIDKKKRILIYLIFLIILGTISNKTIETQEKFSITISSINVSGLSSNDNLELTNKLNNFFYKNIFVIGKDEIEKIISQYPIIEQYSIKKVYPNKLDINIKPAKFIAKISNKNQLVVGSNGKLITSEIIDESLPSIFGEFESKKFLEFQKNIENSKLKFSDFNSIFFYPSNRFDILMTSNILVKFPHNEFLKSLNLAYKIMKNDQFKNIKLIDLRNSNQVIIK